MTVTYKTFARLMATLIETTKAVQAAMAANDCALAWRHLRVARRAAQRLRDGAADEPGVDLHLMKFDLAETMYRHRCGPRRLP